MAERLRLARERSKQRKELLKHTLGVDDLSAALGSAPAKSGSPLEAGKGSESASKKARYRLYEPDLSNKFSDILLLNFGQI
jgi:hypothetical protein